MWAERLRAVIEARVQRPEAVREAAVRRVRPTSLTGPSGKLMVIAADHTARGLLGAGRDPLAMADRGELLERLVTALERPGVNGVLGTADVLDDLLLLGALEGKVVLGSMNRGGIAGASWELDDRFTGYDAAAIETAGFEGGKLLLRVDPADPLTASTLEASARAVDELARRGLLAMVEPFVSHRREDGRLRNDLSPDAVIRSATIAAGLGSNSAHTWLKLPVADDPAGTESMHRVLAATTLPVVLLGGEVRDDPDAVYERWREVLRLPTARGLVVGRSLLYPPDGDVAAAVDTAVGLL